MDKLTNCNTKNIICQERKLKKVDSLDIGALREMVIQAVKECMDPEVLDLILKILANI